MAKPVKKENSSPDTYEPDQKDMAILKLLQGNARITVKEISERIHLSTTPVYERIKRMEETGIIRQYATLVDPAKVKKGLTVICYVSLKEHSKTAGSKFIKTIQGLDEIVECFNISGAFDFMLRIAVENMDAYYNFHVNKLSEVENIGNVQSTFVMGIIKQTHVLVY